MVDPNLGVHWQLVPDLTHPGGPARWVQVGQGEPMPAIRPSSPAHASGAGFFKRAWDPSHVSQSKVVIRNGETVVIEQESAIIHARFLAVALACATAGQRIPVILARIKGFEPGATASVIHVMATGNGRARWAPEQEGDAQ
jgi:hypothetical protein